MQIKTKSMLIKTEEALTKLTIEVHKDPYFFTETGLSFFKKMPEFLSEIAKDEEEYDRLFMEFRNKLPKFLYDEVAIKDLVDTLLNKILKDEPKPLPTKASSNGRPIAHGS